MHTHGELDGDRLDALAQKYDADHLMLDQGHALRSSAELTELGWSTVLEPVHGVQAVVLEQQGEE